MPRGWKREIWYGKLGYRKRSDSKGEQCIEKQLFNGGAEGCKLVFSNQHTNLDYRVRAIYHNMPLANQRNGQVIVDAFGVLETDKSPWK